MLLEEDDGTDRGYVGYPTSNNLVLRNNIHSGEIALVGENVSGTERTMLQADPDGGVDLYNTGTLILEVHGSGITVQGAGNQISAGSGTPEGVVTASKGSIFMRTNGGAGTCMYVKETSTGNTGWVAK
jgi:hypothetical protein